MADPSAPFPLPPLWRAIVIACCPQAAAFDDATWQETERLMLDALSRRPRGVQRRVRWFVQALPWLAVPLAGRSFARLSPARQASVLRLLAKAPIPAIRHGVWGVRTLACLGVYGHPGVTGTLGWRPDSAGWEGRRRGGVPTPPRGERRPPLRLVP